MKSSQRVWIGLALAGAIAGVCVLVLGAVGYALGLNDTSGVLYHSNVVPMSLFAGVVLLFASGALLLARSPQALAKCPTTLAIAILALIAWSFVALYVKHVSPLIAVRADIVMGSESQFVDHIIRYRAGQPQYTPVEDANSSAYTPGAPLLTYLIASALGHSTSIPTFRLIQQFYLLLAVFFAAAAARELLRLCQPGSRFANLWLLFWVPFLYLIANNPYTNLFTHVLYSDGLALAVDALAFWLLVKHFTTGDDRWLIAMAVVPMLGFLAKQKEAVWAALYVVYLLLLGRVAWRRILLFGVATSVLVGLAAGICYGLWGGPFYFWTFQVLAAIHVGLRKLLEQISEGGWYILMGLIGGVILLRRESFQRLFPVWFCWFLLMSVAIYTSGMAYTPAHLGPATLLGAVWLLVALSTIWPEEAEERGSSARAAMWLQTAVVPGLVLVFFVSGGILRIDPAVPPGLGRYIAEIEKEFEGMRRDRVLLDTGSWVYLTQNVVMKDRESPLGTLWATNMSDFAMPIKRIREHYYDKILVRKLKDEEFLYSDPRIRQALAENYREIRAIPSPGVPKRWLYEPLLYDVGVLEPREHAQSPDRKEASAPKRTELSTGRHLTDRQLQ